MAKIRIKRSNVVTNSVAKPPTASQMDFGELAVNYNTFDPVLFIKDSNNDIIRLTGNNLITSVFGNTGDIVAGASDYATFYAPSAHVGTGDSQHAAVTTTANGFMVAGDKAKLDGITAGAQPNVITSWNGRTTSNIVPTVGDYDLTELGDVNISSPSDGQVISWNSTSSKFEAINQTPVTNLTTSSNSTTVSVNSSTGSNTSIAGATQTNAGLLIATDKTKLDSINTSINETTASGEFKNVKSNWSTTDNTLDSFIKNKPTIPTTLGSLTDVDVSGLGNDKIIKYNSSNSQWELDNLSVASGGTVTSIVAGSGLNGGTISTSGTISIKDSYLHSTLDSRYLSSSYVPPTVIASSGGSGGSDGTMTAAMAEKLNIIPNNAQANVQSDYEATSGDAFIKNMPTVPLNLGDFGDVTLSSSQADQVLQYNGSNWVNSGITLNELSNVSAGSPSSGQILSYNGSAWVPTAATSGTTNLGTSTSTSNVTITSSTGNNTAIAVATSSRAGVLDTTLFDKLNGIQTGAQVNPINISAFNNNLGYITSEALPLVNDSLGNLGIGDNVLTSVSSGDRNTGFGDAANQSTSSGDDNTAFGYEALKSVSSGYRNTGIGSKALASSTNGGDVVAIGVSALNSHTSPYNCVAIGNYAAQNISGNFSGNYSVFVGYKSGSGISSGSSKGSNCVYVGREAGQYADGSLNIGIGSSAGEAMDGSNNIEIGYIAGGGYGSIHSFGSNSNRIAIGNNSSTNAYIKIAWSTTSDARDKMNFSSVPYGLEFVNNLKPISFQFKKEREIDEPSGNIRYGFKAQDILSLEGNNPVIIDNEDEDSLKFQSDNLVPVLVKAIQELSAEVSSLKQLVTN